MILTDQKAFEQVLRIVEQAEVFCYILSPWFGSKIALEIKSRIKCSDCKVVVADYFEENHKSYHIFKDKDFRIDPNLHAKIILTEKDCVSGSQNFTERGFFRQHGQFTFNGEGGEDYKVLKALALSWIKSSATFDEKHPIIYWANKNRPLESLPAILKTDSSPEAIEDESVDWDADQEDPSESEPTSAKPKSEDPPEPAKPSEESKASLSEAWRILLGKDQEN